MDRKPVDPASSALAADIRAGAGRYVRERDLRRLIPVGPEMISDLSEANQLRIVALLARSLRSERQRGRSGHWTYDLNRHIGLAQAYAAESRRCCPAKDSDRSPQRRTPPREGRRWLFT